MIRWVQIRNFQSHKETRVEFADGLNCIVGATDAGKSAFVRALRWVFENERFSDFITWGENFASVEVMNTNGVSVTRERVVDTNRYIIKYPDGRREESENFGTTIPLKVREALNEAELVLDKERIINLNIRSQHDPFFLIHDGVYTGTTRSKALNSLIGTHLVDNAVRSVVADIKKKKSEAELLERDCKALQVGIAEYSNVPTLEQGVIAAKDLLVQLKELSKKHEEMLGLLQDLDRLHQKEQDYRNRRAGLKSYKDVDVSELFELLDRRTVLCYLISTVAAFQERAAQWQQQVDQTRHYNESDVAELDKLLELRKQYVVLSLDLDFYQAKVVKYESTLELVKKTVGEREAACRKTISELGVCPTCFSEIDSKKVDEIMRRL